MIPTKTEVIQVSRGVVQVIFRASARTSRRNCRKPTRFLGTAPVARADDGATAAAVRAARSFIA